VKSVPPPPEPKLAPATTSNIDRKTATSMLFAAFTQKNEHQAVELIKLGADPNGRDQYGVPALNWAVMMCMPQAVKELIDRKADLAYQRAPGMTIMAEAGACPEAARILKAAGAK
jgi:ankyrin repeat protein